MCAQILYQQKMMKQQSYMTVVSSFSVDIKFLALLVKFRPIIWSSILY